MNNSGKITKKEIENLLTTMKDLENLQSSVSSVTVTLNNKTTALLTKSKDGTWEASINIQQEDRYGR